MSIWAKPRPPERIPEILEALDQAWSQPVNVDQRLGQLLINVIRSAEDNRMTPEDIERRLWGIEDDRLLGLLRAERERLP